MTDDQIKYLVDRFLGWQRTAIRGLSAHWSTAHIPNIAFKDALARHSMQTSEFRSARLTIAPPPKADLKKPIGSAHNADDGGG